MKLPALFKEIIEHDAKRPGQGEPVVPIGIARDIKDWRKRRTDLTLSAEKFIRRQRGGGAA